MFEPIGIAEIVLGHLLRTVGHAGMDTVLLVAPMLELEERERHALRLVILRTSVAREQYAGVTHFANWKKTALSRAWFVKERVVWRGTYVVWGIGFSSAQCEFLDQHVFYQNFCGPKFIFDQHFFNIHFSWKKVFF